MYTICIYVDAYVHNMLYAACIRLYNNVRSIYFTSRHRIKRMFYCE